MISLEIGHMNNKTWQVLGVLGLTFITAGFFGFEIGVHFPDNSWAVVVTAAAIALLGFRWIEIIKRSK
jgi:hypothetical protein